MRLKNWKKIAEKVDEIFFRVARGSAMKVPQDAIKRIVPFRGKKESAFQRIYQIFEFLDSHPAKTPLVIFVLEGRETRKEWKFLLHDGRMKRNERKTTRFQNNTVDPAPTISLLYRLQGSVHTRRNNRFHSADLASSESTSGSFHFVPRDRGRSLDTPDAPEQANFKGTRSESR